MPASDTPTVSGLPAEKLMAAALSSTPVSSPAFAWVPPALEEVAPWFPDYEVQALIGRGAMGAVYRAVQRKLERPVAIKLLPPEIAAREGAAARFEREARAMSRLNHPNIVALHDFGRTAEGHLFIVMEYVDGADLSRLIHAEGGGLGVPQALEIIGQVCDALQFAHSRGFVHRDIKPGNILVDTEGRVKIADFGLAKLLDTPRDTAATLTGQALGTPDYSAPEQLKGAPVDHRADIYSLGVMLYEMLTGDLPRGAWTPPSQRTTAPARLDEVVTRAMQTEPDRRYQQASEVKAAVTAREPAAPARDSSAVNRVMLWLMFAFIVASAFITPTGDIFTMLMLAAPFIALAVYFRIKRRPAGMVALLLAGMAMGAAVMLAVIQFDEFGPKPTAPAEKPAQLSAVELEILEMKHLGYGQKHPKVQALQAKLLALQGIEPQQPAKPPAPAISKSEAVDFATGRAAALTEAMRSFVAAVGTDKAAADWKDKSPEVRYALVKGYLPYAADTLQEFTPAGFEMLLPEHIADGARAVPVSEAVRRMEEQLQLQEARVRQLDEELRALATQAGIVDTTPLGPGDSTGAAEPKHIPERENQAEYSRRRYSLQRELQSLEDMHKMLGAARHAEFGKPVIVPGPPVPAGGKVLIIQLKDDGSCEIGGQAYEEAKLREYLKNAAAQDRKQQVRLSGASDTPYTAVSGVLAMLHECGLHYVDFTVQSKPPDPAAPAAPPASNAPPRASVVPDH